MACLQPSIIASMRRSIASGGASSEKRYLSQHHLDRRRLSKYISSNDKSPAAACSAIPSPVHRLLHNSSSQYASRASSSMSWEVGNLHNNSFPPTHGRSVLGTSDASFRLSNINDDSIMGAKRYFRSSSGAAATAGGPNYKAPSREKRRNNRREERDNVWKEEVAGRKLEKRSKGKKKKKPPGSFVHRTHGETGRRVMTGERLDEILDSPYSLPMLPRDAIPWDSTKNIVHIAQRKMSFQQRYEHVAEGPRHDNMFFATLRTTLDRRNIMDTSAAVTSHSGKDNNTIELVNTGAARSKKKAENLAAADLICNLAEEFGIDIRNPPNIKQLRKAEAQEKFKADVQMSQMILEVLGASRPKFDTRDPTGLNKGYVSDAMFYCRGAPVRASSGEEKLARSKAEAEGKALMAATAPGSVLEQFVGQRKVDEIISRIVASPAGHVATLHVQPLPDEALDALAQSMGPHSAHVERMEQHAEMKARHEQQFLERRKQRGERSESHVDGRDRHPGNIVEMNEAFTKEEELRAERASEDPGSKQAHMKGIRDALPIQAIQTKLIDALRSQQVVVVSGGTGSGKSTQCPQYILEDAIAQSKGSETRIVVTQPRRIAAISVAERIADERDETIGNSVGYTVRFNRKAPRDGGSIEFVTTGVLLRRLVNDPSLQDVSHVMIDEVHERDIDTDFLLVLLRDLLEKRPDLRVVLMSATLDAESFGRYFSRDGAVEVPVMSVPAKPRHPVEVIHLEDMSCEESDDLSGEIPSEVQKISRSLLRMHDQQLQLELEEAIAEDAAAVNLEARSMREDEGKMNDSDDSESDSDSSDSDSDNEQESNRQSSTRLEVLQRAVSMRRGKGGKTAQPPVQNRSFNDKREIGEITTKLLAKIAQHVAKVEMDAGRKGSVLCFLPGLDEIKEAMKILEEESDYNLRKKMKILPLHSTIPQDDQQKVFIPAADGTVKVILATNIAESSVTIDDVLAVVDGGLVRELNWDAEKAMSAMVTVPTSKASSTQRLGRAGRVAPGKCYRIYSRGQHAAMLERPMPEIQRTALEATCLNTCTMTTDSVEKFLSSAMDPPKEEAVASSMDRLKKLGAIAVDQSTGAETLSPLGNCLSRLPLDPATGKMLIMGCVMQCLDPVLTAAACFSSREVFYTPPGMREEQRKERQKFSEDSDIMASVRAYHDYQDIMQEEGWNGARQWANDSFVSINALSSIHSVRSQLINELHRIGLVQNSDLEQNRRGGRGRSRELREGASVNRNSGSEGLCSAIWSTGLPDNLAARRQISNFGTLRTRMENHAGLHPSSVAFHRKPPKHLRSHELPPWFLYKEMVLSSQVFLRGCTALEPEQILLFGGYSLESNNVQRVIDDWIIVQGSCDDTLDFLSTARAEINAALDLKVMSPKIPLPEKQQLIIDGVSECFEILDEA